jgi:hypothetical protein
VDFVNVETSELTPGQGFNNEETLNFFITAGGRVFGGCWNGFGGISMGNLMPYVGY